jgi:tRNA dimethylallyltransferase
MITILGPTATGKTRLAALVASRLNGEIISADSRQVYRGMNLGTGKDYDDYIVDDRRIPYHLIDIADPGYEYNVHEFQLDFSRAYRQICSRGKLAVLCGGTGMYIEAVLKGYRMPEVPENPVLHRQLELLSHKELTELLLSLKIPHNVSDTSDRSRLVRAIEIGLYPAEHPDIMKKYTTIDSIIFGIRTDRSLHREMITERLRNRLKHGMVEEVERLIAGGLMPDRLKFYGLEYKYLTQYVTGEIPYDVMFRLLNTAIHQFAKRQMTWFRRMERNGSVIYWIDGSLKNKEKLEIILSKMNKSV